MAIDRDYLGEKLRLVERAREDAYFRKLDQELIDRMRQQAAAQAVNEAETAGGPQAAFSPLLVPVDFSSYSRQALERAAVLAERFDATVIALHVVDSELGVQTLAGHLGKPVVAPAVGESDETAEISDDEIKTMLDDQRAQAYEALQAFLPPLLANCPLELRVLFGRPFERIIETAVKEEVALIVMGTHGRTGLAHIVLGSIAERVVRLAPCAVLTVKAPTSESENWLKEFYNTFLGIGS